MLSEAIVFPSRGDGALKWLAIGGFLSLASVLVLPQFGLYDYYLRTLEAGTVGRKEPPSFSDWGGLFVDGLKVFVVLLVYQVVPVVVPTVLATFVLPAGTQPGRGAVRPAGSASHYWRSSSSGRWRCCSCSASSRRHWPGCRRTDRCRQRSTRAQSVG